MNEQLIAKWENICAELRAAGCNVVAVFAEYSESSARFSTRISVTEKPEIGLTEDHVVLDALREIANEWSEVVHSRQNVKVMAHPLAGANVDRGVRVEIW